MELSTLHAAVRSTVRGDSSTVSISGIEGEAFQAWKTKLESVRALAISSAKEWDSAPAPIVLAISSAKEWDSAPVPVLPISSAKEWDSAPMPIVLAH